jgi:hypothetical protein
MYACYIYSNLNLFTGLARRKTKWRRMGSMSHQRVCLGIVHLHRVMLIQWVLSSKIHLAAWFVPYHDDFMDSTTNLNVWINFFRRKIKNRNFLLLPLIFFLRFGGCSFSCQEKVDPGQIPELTWEHKLSTVTYDLPSFGVTWREGRQMVFLLLYASLCLSVCWNLPDQNQLV